MSNKTFELSEIAQRIGLTLNEVTEVRNVSLILHGGRMVTMPKYCPPSLATEAARMALGGDVHFSHMSHGYPVYELDV